MLAGWRWALMAAGAAALAWFVWSWTQRGAEVERLEGRLAAAQAANGSLLAALEDQERESAANSAALAAAQKHALEAAERLRELEKKVAQHADQDCVAGPDLQSLTDGLWRAEPGAGGDAGP